MDTIIENNLKNILSKMPNGKLDGKQIITEMFNNGQQYSQLEYFSFYMEDFINNNLDSNFLKKFYKNGKVIIDTFYNYPIDIKVHSIKENLCPLNDKETIDKILNKYGTFGLIVVNIDCEKDDDYSLRMFQRSLGKKTKYINKSGNHRKIKKSFSIRSIYYYEINTSNQLKLFRQGVNSNYNERKMKYSLDTKLTKPVFSITK